MYKTTITIVADSPAEVGHFLIFNIEKIEEYPSTVETAEQLLKRGTKGIVWHTEMNVISEDTPQWRSINREVGEHVASIVENRWEVRASYNREGLVQLIVHNGDHTEDVQLLPDSYGEDNPGGYFYSLAEAMTALAAYQKDLRESETRKICIWPDRDWCEWEDLETYSNALGKSDDFHTVDVSLDIDDEKLDQLISEGVYDLNDSGVLKALVQAWSQDPIMHTPTKCTHDPTANIHCPICDGGLFVCSVCGAAEGELTSECPQTKMTDDQRTAVFEGRLDYRAGQWVEKPSMNPN